MIAPLSYNMIPVSALFLTKILIVAEQDDSTCLYFNHIAFPKQAIR